MNWLPRIIVSCCLLLQSQVLHAETSKKVIYENQKEEIFDLENYLKEVKMIDQEVKDVCTRKVPYEENVCKDVTKYKKECSTIPAHEECRQVNNPICHDETKYEQECSRLPGTQECSNVQVPVCNYETRYENECGTTPSTQECRTVYEQDCRYETTYDNECRTIPGENECRVVVNYRQECSYVSGGQQCHTIPGAVECNIVNGENRCVKIPPRQECSDGPGRQECRQVPYEERECSQGAPRQDCRQVPRQERVCENVPRQECYTVPGQYECRQVPRQEQVCHTETQQQCSTIPGDLVCEQIPRSHEVCEDNYSTVCQNVPAREACKDVPYKENVCKMETKYKDESYECTKVIKVPQETIVKTHKANVKVQFSSLSEIMGPNFDFSLDSKGQLGLKVTPNDGQEQDDKKVAIAAAFVKKTVKNEEQGKVNNIKANYSVLLLDKNEHLDYLQTPKILSGKLTKDTFKFLLSGKLNPKRSALLLTIGRYKYNWTQCSAGMELDFACRLYDKAYAEQQKINLSNITYKYVAKGKYTEVLIDLKAEKIKLTSLFGKPEEYMVYVQYAQDYTDAGELMLSKIKDFNWLGYARFNLEK